MTELSRRGLMRTTAWTAPAVAIAAAAPAFATSPTCPTPLYNKAWKEPGNGKAPKKGSFITFGADHADNVRSVTINGVLASWVYVAKRKTWAWGIDGQKNSKTPLNVKVTTTDGVEHDLGIVKFLPWPAAKK